MDKNRCSITILSSHEFNINLVLQRKQFIILLAWYLNDNEI